MAILASGSDPTVMHCCKTAKSKASLVFFTGLRHGSWLFHRLEACTIRVQCLDKRAYFCWLLHRLEGDWIHCSAVKPGAVGKGAVERKIEPTCIKLGAAYYGSGDGQLTHIYENSPVQTTKLARSHSPII